MSERVEVKGNNNTWHKGTLININEYREPEMRYCVLLDDYQEDFVFVPEDKIRYIIEQAKESLK